MFGMKHLTMMCVDRRPTEVELKKLEDDYPLSKHARILYCIGPDFQEPLDDHVLMNEDERRVDSEVDLEFVFEEDYNEYKEEQMHRDSFHPSFVFLIICLYQGQCLIQLQMESKRKEF